MTDNLKPAGLFRRFAAMVYDGFLIAALLMLVSTPPVMINGGPFLDGTAAGSIKNFVFFIYLVAWVTAFYGWFWTHGGQTLGMSAWKIRVISDNTGKLTWKQVIIRCLSAVLGLGNLSSPFNNERKGWHEYLSHTKTVHITREPNRI